MLLSLWLLANSSLGATQPILATGRVRLPENVQPVAPAQLVRATLTLAEAATPLEVELVLKIRHFPELQRRVAAGEIISRAEMAARFLPEPADYQGVAAWAARQGLSVHPGGAGRCVVRTRGTPNQWRDALQASFARVQSGGVEYTAAVAAPSLPAEIAAQIANIHGLQPYLHARKRPAIGKDAAVSSPVAAPYLVGDILNAYDAAASGLTGAGQQIGVIMDTVPQESDLTAFWAANGVAQSLDNIIPINVRGEALPAPSGEETIDVSWSSGIAAGAQVIIYACGSLAYVNAAYSRILDDLQDGSRPNLHQIVMSYGAGEISDETPADLQSADQLLTAIAAYGVTLFAASGDDGCFGNANQDVQACFPASDPVVTGVGGTSLSLDPLTGAVTAEVAWGGANPRQVAGVGGSSGGGVSSYFERPAWQTGDGMPAGAMRLIPDVSLSADPSLGGYLVFRGAPAKYGGTSWGTPAWAGLCAMLNQARAAAELPPLGAANGAFYPLQGTACFRDILSGSNGAYAATNGYDLVTGLGVPDFDLLYRALGGRSNGVSEATVQITSALATSTSVGSSFSYQITASGAPNAYVASGLPAGLTLDAAGGLISGSPAAAGTYLIELGATGAGGTGSATLTLIVEATPLPAVSLAVQLSQVALSSGAVGSLLLSLPAALPNDLTVNYTVKGSAINGVDFAYLKGRAKFKAGVTSRPIKIRMLGNLQGANRKVVKLTLAPGEGYIVGTTGAGKVTLWNQ